MTAIPRNWAGNVTFSATEFHRPTSLADLQKVVADADRVHALGSGHSFNRIGDTSGDLISVADLPPLLEIDSAAMTVTTGAGVRYGTLGDYLHRHGFGLRNLASLPHISVAGAVATATHGSGIGNQNLATEVVAQELVLADGSVLTQHAGAAAGDEPAAFAGSVVGLGALGIVTNLTLQLVPTYAIAQYVYDDVDFATFHEHTDEMLGSAYSVSLFTDWRASRFNTVWLKQLPAEAPTDTATWMGARLADGQRHPVPSLSGATCSVQGGVPGPWHDRLPHFRLEFTPSNGDELQSEYLLPREHLTDALRALDAIRDQIAPALQVCEVRTIAADDLWLSMSYQQDSCAFHFTWFPDATAADAAVGAIEQALEPFRARPHWGKVFTTSPARLHELYPRLPDFEQLRAGLDPTGKFRNELLDRVLR